MIWHRIRSISGLTQLAIARCSANIGSAAAAARRTAVFDQNSCSQEIFFCHVSRRFFAAPIQAKPKTTVDSSTGPRLNEAITAPFVRLVMDEGHCIVSREDALRRARKLDLDLVEVQRTADPPVCKIMDFHKEKFKQEVKEKERMKSKSAVALRSGENKEVRFKAKTELKDIKIKAESITRLMEKGYRVKCTAMTAGKEDEDLGGLLSCLVSLIEDVSVVESGPHVDTSKAYVIVRHVKFASKKSGKKGSKSIDAKAKAESTSSTEADIQADEWDPVESISDGEDGIISTFTESGESEGSENRKNATDRGNFNFNKPMSQKLQESKIIGEQEIQSKTSRWSTSDSHSSPPEPSAVEVNRYSRPKVSQNQGRSPQHPYEESRGRQSQPDFKQRQPHSNIPSSSPNYGSFSGPRIANNGDRNRTSPVPKFGNFLSNKNTTDAGTSETRSSNSTTQNCGVLSSIKTPSIDPSIPGSAKTSNTAPRTFGIFSSTNSPASSDKEAMRDSTLGRSSDISSAKRYGIFSNTKSPSSSDQ